MALRVKCSVNIEKKLLSLLPGRFGLKVKFLDGLLVEWFNLRHVRNSSCRTVTTRSDGGGETTFLLIYYDEVS